MSLTLTAPGLALARPILRRVRDVNLFWAQRHQRRGLSRRASARQHPGQFNSALRSWSISSMASGFAGGRSALEILHSKRPRQRYLNRSTPPRPGSKAM